MNIVYSDPKVIVFEEPPCVRTLVVNASENEEVATVPPWTEDVFLSTRTRFLRLALPWQVYAICHTKDYSQFSIYLGFRNSELTQADQMLYYPHLWNIFPDMRVCLGGLHEVITHQKYASREDFCNVVLNAPWGTTWIRSLGLHQIYLSLSAYSKDPRIATWKSWEVETRKDPAFITTVNWTKFALLDQIIHEKGYI